MGRRSPPSKRAGQTPLFVGTRISAILTVRSTGKYSRSLICFPQTLDSSIQVFHEGDGNHQKIR